MIFGRIGTNRALARNSCKLRRRVEYGSEQSSVASAHRIEDLPRHSDDGGVLALRKRAATGWHRPVPGASGKPMTMRPISARTGGEAPGLR